MYYTTNGDMPRAGAGTLYTGQFTLAYTTTLRAVAMKADMTDSPVATGVFTITPPPRIAAPVLTTPPGIYRNAVLAGITCATPGTTIYYTLDGTPPTRQSPVYQAPMDISVDSRVRTIAVKEGMLDSAETTGFYTILMKQRVATPAIIATSTSFSNVLLVTLTCATPGAVIRYTTDGSLPDNTSSVFSGAPIRLINTTTLRVKGFKLGLLESFLVEETFTKRAEAK